MAVSPEVLAERIEALKTENARIHAAIEANAKRLEALERAKGWLSGAVAAVGFLFGIFADSIKKAWGI